MIFGIWRVATVLIKIEQIYGFGIPEVLALVQNETTGFMRMIRSKAQKKFHQMPFHSDRNKCVVHLRWTQSSFYSERKVFHSKKIDSVWWYRCVWLKSVIVDQYHFPGSKHDSLSSDSSRFSIHSQFGNNKLILIWILFIASINWKFRWQSYQGHVHYRIERKNQLTDDNFRSTIPRNILE